MADTIVLLSEEKMEKAVAALQKELSLIRTGRANPAVLNNVKIDYYGVLTPINQLASISVPEAQLIVIKPFDKGQLKEIEKAILVANLNLTPQNDGTVIRINFPALTEQRRKELAKEIKVHSEQAKVSCRNIRREGIEALKKLEKNKELSEDDLKYYEEEVQKIVDKKIVEIDNLLKDKEKQIMEI